MAKKPKPLTDQIRQAILNADKTRYQIAKETGLAESNLSRFVNGLAGMSMQSLDKIGACLGLEVTTPPKKKRGSKRK